MDEACSHCPSLTVTWRDANHFSQAKVRPQDLCRADGGELPRVMPSTSQVGVIFASTDDIRTCRQCRKIFNDSFLMPEIWWSGYCRNANGYFGHEETAAGFNTWMYFEVKQVYEDIFFRWNTVNVFARWFTSTHQTIVLIFDANSDLEERILESLLHTDMSHLRDPFWVYPPLLEEVVSLFDSATWAIRDRVRTIELGDKPAGRPRPDYRRLHDIARHAIHVTESLDVTVQNVGQIIQHHEGYLARTSNKDDLPSFPQYSIQSRLQFFQSWLGSLQHRSLSNEKRLQNEIQLAFNSVAQYDAGISVELGRAAQSDSAAMRTISFVTLTFLPPTFICAVFSMSFFNHTADGAWTVSTEFWIYWAIAIPTSIVTALLWHYWCYCSSLVLRMTKKSQSTFDCEGQSEAMMGTSRDKPSHSSQPTTRPTIEQDAYRGWSFFETVRSGSDKR